MEETVLRAKKIAELRELAKAAGIPAAYKYKKDELIERLLQMAAGASKEGAEEEAAAPAPEEAAAERAQHRRRGQEARQEHSDRPQQERQGREEVFFIGRIVKQFLIKSFHFPCRNVVLAGSFSSVREIPRHIYGC